MIFNFFKFLLHHYYKRFYYLLNNMGNYLHGDLEQYVNNLIDATY